MASFGFDPQQARKLVVDLVPGQHLIGGDVIGISQGMRVAQQTH